jgi:hypothetical protein
MSTANPFPALHVALAEWHESLEDLLLMLQNDKPSHDTAALVGQIEDDVTEALANLDRVRECASRGEQLWQAGSHVQAVHQIAQAHGLLAEIIAHMGGRAASPLRLQHIALIVQQRGSQWSGWSQVVLRALTGWSASAAEVLKKLGEAWRTLAATHDDAEDVASPSQLSGNFPTIHQQN